MPLTSSATQTLSQNGHHPLLSRYRVSIGATGAGLAGCEPRRSLICSQLGAAAAAAVMVGAEAARRVAIAIPWRGPLWLHARPLLTVKPRAVGASGAGQKACAHDAIAESTSTANLEVIVDDLEFQSRCLGCKLCVKLASCVQRPFWRGFQTIFKTAHGLLCRSHASARKENPRLSPARRE